MVGPPLAGPCKTGVCQPQLAIYYGDNVLHYVHLDAIIPILLDKCTGLAESSMSAMFIHVKWREHPGGVKGYMIDEETCRFFSEKQDARPYVTLVADVGVDPPSPAVMLSPDVIRTSSNETPTCRVRTSSKGKPDHSRYSIRAYGCSDAAWKAVGNNVRSYKHVFGKDGLFDEHPRQDARSLDHVRRMVYPVQASFSPGDSKEDIHTEVVRPSAAVEVGRPH
ncbi:hypothetical protein F5I97DRAFT_56076 [Phlebopus sp. FC_14]|nr:hypothetical protein F5I97DRAFT_56076 [Phlebopus sp. FC_14]